MIYRDFQDLQISQLAMGCMRLPKTSDNEADIDIEQAKRMVQAAMDAGVNYFDTAWGYHAGNSERVMGQILSQYPRQSFMLASKFPGYDPANWGKVEEIFEEQLRKCQVDYFDFYLFHNVCEMNIDAYLDDETYGIYSYLMEQKRTGRIRHLGFSVHGTQTTFERFLDAYGNDMEFCQIQLNYMDWDFQDARSKVAKLNQLSIPIWVMEPMRGGMLANPPENVMAPLQKLRPQMSPAEWALRYLQSIPGVTTILTGASTFEQLSENTRILSTDEPLDEECLAALEQAAARLVDGSVPCTACRYCLEHCPQQLDIPTLIMLYNQRKLTGAGDFMAPMALSALPEERKPGACLACGSCETVCPQQLPISQTMQAFAEMYK